MDIAEDVCDFFRIFFSAYLGKFKPNPWHDFDANQLKLCKCFAYEGMPFCSKKIAAFAMLDLIPKTAKRWAYTVLGASSQFSRDLPLTLAPTKVKWYLLVWQSLPGRR